MMLQLLVLLASLLGLTYGLDITGSIESSHPHLPSAALLPPSTLLVLSAPDLEYKTHSSSSGSFAFHNVTAGPSYLLHVECITHTFQLLRVDTQNGNVEVYQTFKGNAWSHRGAKLAYPIRLAPSAKADYYVPRSGFKIDAIFKSPMLLLAMFSLAIVFIIPKMTASLDPEALAEYRAQQAQTAAQAPQLPSFDIASFMAGSSKKSAPAPNANNRKTK